MAIKTEGEETSWLTLSKEIERGFTCQRHINFPRGDAPPPKNKKDLRNGNETSTNIISYIMFNGDSNRMTRR
jgi:hypothetical protein